MLFSREHVRTRKGMVTIVIVLCAMTLSLASGLPSPVHAAGNPPEHPIPAPGGGVDNLHGSGPGMAHGAKRYKKGDRLPNGKVALYSGIYNYDPVILIHGICDLSPVG